MAERFGVLLFKIQLSLFVMFFLFVVNTAMAAPPSSPYAPGETLDPGCVPGGTNCTVVAPITADENLSGGAILFGSSTSGVGQSPYALYWDRTYSRLGVGTSTPAAKAHVVGDSGQKALLVSGQGPTDGDVVFRTETNNNLDLHLRANWNGATSSAYWSIRSKIDGSFDISDVNHGTTALLVASSGFVGVGESNPYASLQIYSTTTGNLTGDVTYQNYPLRVIDAPGVGSGFYTVADLRMSRGGVSNRYGALGFTTDDTQGVFYTLAQIGAYPTLGAGNAMAGDLVFFVKPSSTQLTEGMRLTSTGFLGVGTSSPASNLHVVGTSTFTGRVGIGTSTPNELLYLASSEDADLSLSEAADITGSPFLRFIKSRGSQLARTIVQYGDKLGGFDFVGYDGASELVGAYIRADVDATPGSGDMPASLIFGTTPDGAASSTERMRIMSSGRLVFNTSTPGSGAFLHFVNPTSTGVYPKIYFEEYSDSLNTNQIVNRKARGTQVAPLPVINNDRLLFLGAAGYRGDGFSSEQAAILMRAAANWTTTSTPTYIDFEITPQNSTSRSGRMSLTSQGQLYVNGSGIPSSTLHVVGSTTITDGLDVDFGTLYVDASTNRVGVGTTTPGSALTVAGDIKATGVIRGAIDSPNLEFKPVINWNFASTTTGWIVNAGSLGTPDNSAVRFTASGGDPYMRYDFSSREKFDGGLNHLVKARYRWISGTLDNFEIFYEVDGGGHYFSGSYNKVDSNVVKDGNWHTITFDMSQLTNGGTDWVDNTITKFRLDLGGDATTVIDLDWIAIGGSGFDPLYFEDSVVFKNNAVLDGRFAIGTTTQGALLSVVKSANLLYTDPSLYLAKFNADVTYSGDTGSNLFGVSSVLNQDDTSHFSGSMYAGYFEAKTNNIGWNDGIYGLYSKADSQGNGVSSGNSTVNAILGELSVGASGGTNKAYIFRGLSTISGAVNEAYGLYLPNITGATTTYGIYTAGGTNYFGGAVGIGTTTPQSTFHVIGSSTITNALNVDSGTLYVDAGNNRVGVGTTTLSNAGLTVAQSTSNRWITFFENTTEHGYIGPEDGNSLLLRAGNFLRLQGNIIFQDGTDYYGSFSNRALLIGDNYAVAVGSPPVNGLLVEGNVGIANTSPSSTLHVVGTSTFTGRVGIGTSLPSSSLHLLSNSTTTLSLQSTLSGGKRMEVRSGGGLYRALEFFDATSDKSRLSIESDGRLNIGDAYVDAPGQGVTSSLRIWGDAVLGYNSITYLPQRLFFNQYYPTEGNYSFISANTSDGLGMVIHYGSHDNGGLRFETLSTEPPVMYLTPNREVGVGTTTPQSTFHVIGSSTITNALNVDSGTLYVDAGNNRVGVGTTSPGAALDVKGSIWMATDDNVIGSGNDYGTPVNSASGYLQLYNGASGATTLMNTGDYNMNFGTDNGVDVTIDRYGSVGIGTTTPQSTFHVIGSSTITNALNVDSGTLYVDAGNNRVGIGTLSPSSTLHVVGISTFTGNVGIGTTDPSYKLQVDSGSVFVNPQSTSIPAFWSFVYGASIGLRIERGGIQAWDLGVADNGDFFLAKSGVNTPLTITKAASYVGIGTTTPAYVLHVATTSDSNVAGFTDANGTCTINPTNTALDCSSDERLKTDIQTLESSLERVLALRGVSFKWKTQQDETRRIGFIAQEVEGVIPELVNTAADGYKSLGYANFVPYLVGAVQELNEKMQSGGVGLQLQGSMNSSMTFLKIQVAEAAEFLGRIVARNEVVLSGESVGQARLLPQDESVKVSFDRVYETQPIVTVTPTDFVKGAYAVRGVDTQGFEIVVNEPQMETVTFNWHAFGSEGARVSVSDGSTENIFVVVREAPKEEVSSLPNNNGQKLDDEGNREEVPEPAPTSTSSSTLSQVQPVQDDATSTVATSTLVTDEDVKEIKAEEEESEEKITENATSTPSQEDEGAQTEKTDNPTSKEESEPKEIHPTSTEEMKLLEEEVFQL